MQVRYAVLCFLPVERFRDQLYCSSPISDAYQHPVKWNEQRQRNRRVMFPYHVRSHVQENVDAVPNDQIENAYVYYRVEE